MMRTLASLALVASLLPGATAGATEVYRSTGPAGETSFSDRPDTGAEPIVVPPAAVYEAPAMAKPSAERAEPDAPAYRSARITAPRDESLHWKASGALQVVFETEPALDPGHVAVLLLDGVERARAVGTHRLALPVETLDPGAHELRVIVEDADGTAMVRTDAVRIYLRQHHLNLPARSVLPVGAVSGASS